MKAIRVTCPNCGAGLQTPGTLDLVRCTYCDTIARVQRRTGMLARPAPLPHADPAQPVAVQRRGLVSIAVLAAVTMALGVGAAAFLLAGQPAPQRAALAPAPPRPAAPEPLSWEGHRALIADLTGDGTPDVLGRNRRDTREDTVRIMLLDGATGQMRWESPPLGVYSETYQGTLALVGDLLLFASARGDVRAFAAANGQPRWSTRLDERTVGFCDAGDTVIAIGADDLERPLRRTDGTPVPSPPPRAHRPRQKAPVPPCHSAPSDGDSDDLRHANYALGERHGMTSPALASGPAGRVLAGMRQTGTQVPMLAALDDRGRERWKILVPQEPLAADERTPSSVLVSEREVCASYQLQGDEWALACFDMADGRRLWERHFPGSLPTTVQIAGRALLVFGTHLRLLDLATGAPRWTYGDPEPSPPAP